MAIEGIDVSGGAQGAINWPQVRAAGIDFTYNKASEGSNFTDSYYRRNVAGAKANGILTGSYHFYRYDRDPAAQAAHFLATIGQLGPGDLPPMVDIEKPGDGAGPITQPASVVLQGIRTFIAAVEAATGRRCGIYTYPAAWRELFGNTTMFAEQPLWIADYTPPPGPLPGGWQTYVFWQYTSTGQVSGIAGRVDQDRFNGTLEELRMLAGVGAPPPQPPASNRFFPETQHYISHGFKDAWERMEALPATEGVFPNMAMQAAGFPITEEGGEVLSDGASHTVQYFERTRFELHGDKVYLGSVGSELLALKGQP